MFGCPRNRVNFNVASIIIRFYIDAIRKAFEAPESKGPKNPWPKKGVQPVTGMGVAGSVIRIEGGLPENSDSIPGRPADDNASVAAHYRDGGCGLGDSDRRWASRKF